MGKIFRKIEQNKEEKKKILKKRGEIRRLGDKKGELRGSLPRKRWPSLHLRRRAGERPSGDAVT